MIYRVQCGEQNLKCNGRAEGSRCCIGEEVERDGGIGHVIGFCWLKGALGLLVRSTIPKNWEFFCERKNSRDKSGILWCCGVESCVARTRRADD